MNKTSEGVKTTTILIHLDTKKDLDERKLVKEESYNNVIKRLLGTST